MERKKTNGFEKGIGQIKLSDLPDFKKKMMIALGVKTYQTVKKYSKGLHEMKESQIFAVKEVFESYGIMNYRDE